MQKIDLRKELKPYYNPSPKQVEIVDTPAMHFIMIDGHGDPNKAIGYQQAVEALYSMSYTLKFKIKKGKEAIDYPVLPLEGLWWVDDMNLFSVEHKEDWDWTMMIAQPDFVTKKIFSETLPEVEKKKPNPALKLLRFEKFKEGKAAQIMHLGPYAAEAPTIAKLHAFIAEQGYKLKGKHHEIYLSDPRKSAPEKMKTIIRQPFGN
jgi:hypothetical protein